MKPADVVMDPPGNTNITLLLAPCIPTFNIRYIDWNNQIKGNQSSCQQFTAEGCDASLQGYPAPPHVPRPLSLSNDLVQSQSTQRITGGKCKKTYLIDTSRGNVDLPTTTALFTRLYRTLSGVCSGALLEHRKELDSLMSWATNRGLFTPPLELSIAVGVCKGTLRDSISFSKRLVSIL